MLTVAQPSTSAVRELVAARGMLAPALDDHDRIERVRLFEDLTSVAAAAQALEARDFDRSQRAEQAVAGEPVARQGRGVAGQLALARRCSPWAAQRWLGWCKVLPEELPHTFAALQAGVITEWRASLVARETLFLSRADRMAVDAELAPRLPEWGDKRVAAESRRAAYRLDPHGSLERSRAAEKDRRVTLRPAPDTMTRLTALLPVKQVVAAYAALCRAADTTTAGGDERGRGQIMADTLVERITGQATADAVPVDIALLMTDATLFGQAGEPGADEPGELLGYGPIPADLARDLALGTDTEDDVDEQVNNGVGAADTTGTTDTDCAADGDSDSDADADADRVASAGRHRQSAARRRLRRLFLHPATHQLMTMDAKSREFTRNERRFIRYRDQDTCRTPWCDAQIRHIDHIHGLGHGGDTQLVNAKGLCEARNYAKQAAGWRMRAGRFGTGHTVHIVTPTGHRYFSRAPAPPGCNPDESPVESQVREWLVASRQVASYLMASGFTGAPAAPVNGMGPAARKNS